MARNTLFRYKVPAPCANFFKVTESERVTRLALGGCDQRWPVRLVRRVEVGQSSTLAGRMLISGSIDDICAQIDRLIAQAETDHLLARETGSSLVPFQHGLMSTSIGRRCHSTTSTFQ